MEAILRYNLAQERARADKYRAGLGANSRANASRRNLES